MPDNPPANQSEPASQSEFVRIGLSDPFVRAIVGMVAIAVAISFVVSLLGKGFSAALAVGLALMFGVVLVVLRVLIQNVDSAFVKGLCFFASGVIVSTFLCLAVLLVPAVVICWPQPYHDNLGLPACSASEDIESKPFMPVAYEGHGIEMDPANDRIWIRVNYRPARQADAERIVGALRQAGYKSDGIATNLNEVVTDDRSPGVSLIKATAAAHPSVDEIHRILKLVIPLETDRIAIFPAEVHLINGDIQVDLF